MSPQPMTPTAGPDQSRNVNQLPCPPLISLQVLATNPIPTGSTIQVYDKPMCCSTGVCGPDVDPVLLQFAADLQWMTTQGHQVERYNLAQQPEVFVQNPIVHQSLTQQGMDCLPLILINGHVVSHQGYPTRNQLVQWTANPSEPSSDGCDRSAPATGHTGCGENGCC